MAFALQEMSRQLLAHLASCFPCFGSSFGRRLDLPAKPNTYGRLGSARGRNRRRVGGCQRLVALRVLRVAKLPGRLTVNGNAQRTFLGFLRLERSVYADGQTPNSAFGCRANGAATAPALYGFSFGSLLQRRSCAALGAGSEFWHGSSFVPARLLR